jgi:hypothetical protein
VWEPPYGGARAKVLLTAFEVYIAPWAVFSAQLWFNIVKGGEQNLALASPYSRQE